MRVLMILALSATIFGVSAATPSGDAEWTACTKAPTRACVFDEAFNVARPTPPLQNPVVRVLIAYAAVDPRGALRLVPAAEAYRKTLQGADDRARLDAALVDVYAKARKFPEAERLLMRLKGTTPHFSAADGLAVEVARGRSVAEAIARLRAFDVAPANGFFFTEVAPLAVARGEDAALMAFAEAWAASAKRSGNLGVAYAPVLAVAFAQMKAGKVQPALRSTLRIPPYGERVVAVGLLGDVMTDAGRVDEVLAAVMKVDRVAERNAMLRWMVTPQDFGSPVRSSAAPPVPPLLRPARDTAGAAMQLAASLSAEGRDYAYALIARGCAASGAVAEAWSAARKIETPFASYFALKAIGTAEAKAGDAQASLETLARARASARTDATGDMLHDLMYLHTSLAQFEAAKAMMREEAGKLNHRDAQIALMEAYARAGRVEEAFQTPVENMPDEFRRVSIATALAQGGFSKKAVATTLASREPRDEQDRILTFVVEDRALAGALDDATLVLAAISREGRQLAQVALAKAHAKAGNGAKALALVREALPSRYGPFDGLDFLLRAGSALPK